MRIGRRALTAVSTFLLAAATGHLMQNGEAIAALMRGTAGPLVGASLTSADTSIAPKPRPATVIRAAQIATPALPDLPRLDPAAFDPAVSSAPRGTDPALPPSAADTRYDAFGRACAAPSLTLTALKPAMIGLSLSAPCEAGATVTVSHSGLIFAARTDGAGRFATTVPAMAATGEVRVRVGATTVLDGARPVLDFADVRRVGLVTRAASGLHLTARPGDAASASDRRLTPDDPGLPTLGLGGYLTLLGDPALPQPALAEVFTAAASGPAPRVDLVALTTAENCGRDVIATTLATAGAAPPESGAVSLAMPGCDAAGQRLVLDLGAAARAVALAAD